MEEDDLFYLAPGFDPSSLTVPRLRNILLTHDINYPSNAKKPQLIQLFNDELAPQAKKLLSAAKRVKRSNRGIVDVPSSQASAVDEEEIAEPEPPPPPSTRRGGRRKTKTVEEDSDATLLAPETTSRSRRTTGRRARSIEPDPVEPEPAPPAPAPKPRPRGRPSKTPKKESPDPEAWHKPSEDSPFTADNPFQSGGSSPPAETRLSDWRRKTIESSLGTDKRKSTSSRRKTDGVVAAKLEPDVKSSAYEVPVTTIKRKKSPSAEQELVPAGEEFAPEEAHELAQQEASGQVVRPPRGRQANSSSLIVQALLWPLAISAAFLSTLWIQEKYSVGYCGVGNAPSTEIASVEIPEWADAFRPQCEPCPQHAFCYQDLETKCEDGFVLKHHPLTLGGVLPIPLRPTCEPDSEKARRVQNVVERAVDVLREQNAKYECGEPLEGESKPPKSPAMAEEELKATLSSKRTKRMTQEEFDALFNEAIPEIMSRDEVVSESTGGTRHLRSTSRAKQSLSCAIRTSLRLWLADLGAGVRRKLAEYFWPLVLILLAAGSSFYGKRRIEWRRTEEEWAKDLAQQAFDRLSTHATLHAEDPDAYPEPFLLVSHLRDQILVEDIGKKWVQDLWAKVMAKVKKNSNVRELNQEMRKGDYGLTWEWIGPLAVLPDSAGSRRWSSITGGRRSTRRYSMLPPASSPLSGLSTVPADEDGRQPEMSERKWEESRPIY